MSADFNNPTVDDQYTEILPQIRDNQSANAVMFNGVSVSNIPMNAVQFVSGQFNLWNGAAWNVQPVSIAGGGTGGMTASEARANLGVNSTSESNSAYLKVTSNGSDIDDISIFRTEINVYSKTEADSRNLLVSDNLSTVNNAVTSFNNIKQPATETDTGVVEKAGLVDGINKTPDKFVDTDLFDKLLGYRLATFKANWNGSSYVVEDRIGTPSVSVILSNTGAGTLTVDHALNTLNYDVQLTSVNATTSSCSYSGKTANEFEVYCRDENGTLIVNEDVIITICRG